MAITNDHDKLTARQKLSKLTFDLIRKQPFFGEVLVRLRDAGEVEWGTAFATAERIAYNPDFIDTLTQEEANFVFMHELCHVIWQHIGRRNNRNAMLWNVAADLVINTFLEDSKAEFESSGIVMSTPSNTLHASDFPTVSHDIRDLTVEQVYSRLLEDNSEMENEVSSIAELPPEKGKSGVGSDSNDEQEKENKGTGDLDEQKESENENTKESDGQQSEPDPLITVSSRGRQVTISSDVFDMAHEKLRPENDTQASDAIRRIVTEVQTHSKFHGTCHGTLEKELEDLNGTKIPWYRYVRRYLTSKEECDESYDTPNKNFLWKRKIVPGPVGADETKLADIIIAIDTSGSVFYDKKLLNDFFYQVKCLIRDFEMEGRVITWDTEVGDDIAITDSTDFAKALKKVYGGGGTDIKPVLEYIKKTYKNRYTAVLVLTDGFFLNPETKRMRDLLLVIPKDGDTNWSDLGRVVQF